MINFIYTCTILTSNGLYRNYVVYSHWASVTHQWHSFQFTAIQTYLYVTWDVTNYNLIIYISCVFKTWTTTLHHSTYTANKSFVHWASTWFLEETYQTGRFLTSNRSTWIYPNTSNMNAVLINMFWYIWNRNSSIC